MPEHPPTLYVEGPDDVGVINALLLDHGLDTDKGRQHLFIQSAGSVEKLLNVLPDAVRNATRLPVGFIVDIDIEIGNRWDAIRGRLQNIGVTAPPLCPNTGYIGQYPGYATQFGIWLMPDCQTDFSKLEHFCQSLIPPNHPLWPLAQTSVASATKTIDTLNESGANLARYRDVDRIKAEIHTWISWQEPGAPLGTAMMRKTFQSDSQISATFLSWLRSLYGFGQLRSTNQ